MNRLYYGDNLDVMRRHIKDESVDLVYLDPPFNSNRSCNVLFKQKSGQSSQAQIEAFDDTWTWSQESETTYADLMVHGSNQVANTIEAMRKLLGDNDVLAYLVMTAVALDLLTSATTGTNLSGKDLFQEAYSEHSPKPGRPRLRYPEFVNDKPRWINEHEGTRNLSVGAMQLIRNVTTHSLDPLDPNVAFEYLAALSVIARQVDRATLVKYGDVEVLPA